MFFRKLFFQLFYYQDPPWDTNQTPPEVYEYIQHHPPGRVLDLGCGTGTNLITLAQHGWQAVGVDFVPKAIKAAREKAAKVGVEIDVHIGDVTRLDGVEGFFDLILDIGCYQSLTPSGMRRYRNQIQRLIAPGGAYMIYLFFRPQNKLSFLSGSQISEDDLELFSKFLTLEKREDGTERGHFHSAWLTYRNA